MMSNALITNGILLEYFFAGVMDFVQVSSLH